MFQNFKLSYAHIISIGAISFVLTILLRCGWPMLAGMLLCALLAFFSNNNDPFELKEDVEPTFSKKGYHIIKKGI